MPRTGFMKRTCIQCSCSKFHYGYVGAYGCAENVAQTALAYREMLEWIYNGGAQECPWCQKSKGAGHSDDCELAALLKKKRG